MKQEDEEVFPDVVKAYYVSERGFRVIYDPPKPNLKLTFDGEKIGRAHV